MLMDLLSAYLPTALSVWVPISCKGWSECGDYWRGPQVDLAAQRSAMFRFDSSRVGDWADKVYLLLGTYAMDGVLLNERSAVQ